MREVTRFGPWSDVLQAVTASYYRQYARKHLATPTVGDLNFVYTPQGTPSDPQSIIFTCALPPHLGTLTLPFTPVSTLFTLHRTRDPQPIYSSAALLQL